MKIIGKYLLVASLPFFLATAFEMYLLTPALGPQMLFFSLAHIAPPLLLVVWLSGVAFACLAVFAIGVVIFNLAGALNAEKRYARMMSVVLFVQLGHATLLLTYDRWASSFG